MTRNPLPPYRLDPADPRAPSVEQWAAMTERERSAVVSALPSEFPPMGMLAEEIQLRRQAEIARAAAE